MGLCHKLNELHANFWGRIERNVQSLLLENNQPVITVRSINQNGNASVIENVKIGHILRVGRHDGLNQIPPSRRSYAHYCWRNKGLLVPHSCRSIRKFGYGLEAIKSPSGLTVSVRPSSELKGRDATSCLVGLAVLASAEKQKAKPMDNKVRI